MDMLRIAPFFEGWESALINAALHGCMGYTLTDDTKYPTAAQLVVGYFCFFAGKPHAALVAKAAAPLLVPRDAAWCAQIEAVWGTRVTKVLRYAIRKEADCFHLPTLTGYVNALDDRYTMQLFDRNLYKQAMQEDWSRDFCALFESEADYLRRGLGVAVLENGRLVAGASSYAVYNGGIEIEIDTHVAHRRRGLATACAAKLILTSLDRGLYPSWDAHDLRSVALAEKLGYHLDGPYTAYLMQDCLDTSRD